MSSLLGTLGKERTAPFSVTTASNSSCSGRTRRKSAMMRPLTRITTIRRPCGSLTPFHHERLDAPVPRDRAVVIERDYA